MYPLAMNEDVFTVQSFAQDRLAIVASARRYCLRRRYATRDRRQLTAGANHPRSFGPWPVARAFEYLVWK